MAWSEVSKDHIRDLTLNENRQVAGSFFNSCLPLISRYPNHTICKSSCQGKKMLILLKQKSLSHLAGRNECCRIKLLRFISVTCYIKQVSRDTSAYKAKSIKKKSHII